MPLYAMFMKRFCGSSDKMSDDFDWIIRHFEKIIRHFILSIYEKFVRWSDYLSDDFEQIIRHFVESMGNVWWANGFSWTLYMTSHYLNLNQWWLRSVKTQKGANRPIARSRCSTACHSSIFLHSHQGNSGFGRLKFRAGGSNCCSGPLTCTGSKFCLILDPFTTLQNCLQRARCKLSSSKGDRSTLTCNLHSPSYGPAMNVSRGAFTPIWEMHGECGFGPRASQWIGLYELCGAVYIAAAPMHLRSGCPQRSLMKRFSCWTRRNKGHWLVSIYRSMNQCCKMGPPQIETACGPTQSVNTPRVSQIFFRPHNFFLP